MANGVNCTIVQATDGKWLEWEEDFKASNITVDFPCYDELKRATK